MNQDPETDLDPDTWERPTYVISAFEAQRRAALQIELEEAQRRTRALRRKVLTWTGVVLLIAGLCVLALALGRSASDDTATVTPTVTPGTAGATPTVPSAGPGPSSSPIEPFFAGFGEQTPAGLARVEPLVQPDSPAAAFMYHELRLVNSLTQNDTPPAALTVQLGDQVQVCADEACATPVVYSNFDLDDGRISSFDIDGRPVADLVVAWRGADAPCGASYLAELGGRADDPCSAENMVLTVRSVARNTVGAWTVTYDWKHGTNWPDDLGLLAIDSTGTSRSPVHLMVGSNRLDATSWSSVVPETGSTSWGYATFDVPNGLVDPDAELSIDTVTSDEVGPLGCDGAAVCPLAVQFDGTWSD